MKIAYCTNVFPLEEIPAACIRLKKLGYDGVELWHQFVMSRSLEQIKKEVLDLGLEVAQLCPYFNVTGTKQELEETYRMAKTYVGIARELHCRRIRVFTGRVGASQATVEQYRQGVEGLRTICQMAPDLLFVLETHVGSLMESTETTARLIHDVGQDNLRVNLQVPMTVSREDPYTCAHAIGQYTVHLHAHNWQGDTGNLVCLGEGDYDFCNFLSILAGKGFDGYISIQHGDHYGKENPFDVAEKEAKYLKTVIGGLL